MIRSKQGKVMTPRRAWFGLLGLALAAMAVWAPLTSATTSAGTVATATPSTLYAVLSNKQFVNNGGDRARGEGNNPFGNYVGVSLNIPVNANEKIAGPFPGDFSIFQYGLFSDATHKTAAGSAIFICQYGFDQSSICDAGLTVHGDLIMAKGAVNFASSQFTLGVTGGTGVNRTLKGVMQVTAAGVATQAQPVKRAVPTLQNLKLDLTTHQVAGKGSSGWHSVVISASPSNETFVNNDDDEARGDVNNPWGGINNQAASIVDEHVNGPFAGDEAFFNLKIKTKSGGTGLALFICQYYFNHNGLCHATFNFGGGTLVGEGAFNFDAKAYTLAVTGGYGSYGGQVGEVDASPATGGSQKLTFSLHKA